MASVYILYSEKLNKYYIGSCIDISQRVSEHLNGKYTDSFTVKVNDWMLFYSLNNLGYQQARLIERHIKE